MRNIIFIAPLAAGKGTVSDYLVKHYDYEHLSTGELFREIIRTGSEFGKELDKIILSGALVSDDITIKVFKEKLESFDKNKPFVLDGFPRNLNQAKMLSELLSRMNITNNVVIYLDIDYELGLKRTLGRVVCPNCKKSYNIYFEETKPLKENLCDDCNIELEKRHEDTEETFKKRFDTYLKETKEVIDYYKDNNIFQIVDASQKIDNVINDVIKIIKEVKND